MKKLTFPLVVLLVIIFFVGRYFYFKPDVVNGEQAKPFETELLSGESFSLKQLEGQYVLLDFWGSWCFPCRKENPQLVALYKQFADKSFTDATGFEIVSIAIEESEASWKRAIQADNLNWPYHIMDKTTSLRLFNSPISTLYGVKEVPNTFLLNPDGLIVGVNLPLEKIEARLKEKVKG